MKLIISMFLVSILLIGSVSAIILPLPISGRITNEGDLQGIEVSITNLNTGETQVVHTTSRGGYLYDWANSIHKYSHGDRFRIVVSELVAEFVFDGAPIEADFDLTGIECPVCEECEACDPCIYECPEDTTPYRECDSCCPEPPKCPECVCEYEECPDCPVDYSWAWTLIAGLLVGAGGSAIALNNRIFTAKGTGYRRYVGRDGEEKLLHKHPGIRGYHDPNILHRSPWEKHPKGQVVTDWEWNEVFGRWEFKR